MPMSGHAMGLDLGYVLAFMSWAHVSHSVSHSGPSLLSEPVGVLSPVPRRARR